MIKKIGFLCALYYLIFIVNACCSPKNYLGYFEKVNLEIIDFNKIYVKIAIKSEITNGNPLMAFNSGFKTLNATSCPDDKLKIVDKVKSITIYTNKSIHENYPAFSDISSIFNFRMPFYIEVFSTKEEVISKINQFETNGFASSKDFMFFIKPDFENLDTNIVMNLYCKIQLINDTVLKDSITNFKLKDMMLGGFYN